MPANSRIIFNVISRIANFENPLVLPVQEWIKDQFPTTTQDEKGLSQSLKNAGFTSVNPLANITVAITFLGAILIIFILASLIYHLFKKCSTNPKFAIIGKLYKKLKDKLFWNSLLRSILELYLELIIANMIKLYALNFDDFSEGISSAMAVAACVVLVTFIFFVWRFLFKKFE